MGRREDMESLIDEIEDFDLEPATYAVMLLVYNKEGELHAILKPPFKSAFPEAYLENGKVLWRDNDNYDYTPVP